MAPDAADARHTRRLYMPLPPSRYFMLSCRAAFFIFRHVYASFIIADAAADAITILRLIATLIDFRSMPAVTLVAYTLSLCCCRHILIFHYY